MTDMRRDQVADVLAARAACCAGWDGVVLPRLRLSSWLVSPVVVFDDRVCAERLDAGQSPQTEMSTLAVWEGWSDDLGTAPPSTPLRITGFISTAPPRRALYGLDVLAGYGAGLILCRGVRPPAPWSLRECEIAGVSVVHAGDDHGCAQLVVGRAGPIATARRTVATRQKEELLFSHALRCGVLPLKSSSLRG